MKKSILITLLLGALVSAADPGLIRLRDVSLDPSAPSIMAKGEKLCAPDRNGCYQYLIQPEKNFTNKERAALEEAGVSFIGFVPPNAYIVLATPENLKRLEEKHTLLYVSEYLPEYKNGVPTGRFFNAGSGVKLNIILTSPDCAADFLAFLKEEGAKDVSLICERPPIVRALCGVELVDKLVLRSDVFSVEEVILSGSHLQTIFCLLIGHTATGLHTYNGSLIFQKPRAILFLVSLYPFKAPRAVFPLYIKLLEIHLPLY